MAQVTELSVIALPGGVHSFSAKTEAEILPIAEGIGFHPDRMGTVPGFRRQFPGLGTLIIAFFIKELNRWLL